MSDGKRSDDRPKTPLGRVIMVAGGAGIVVSVAVLGGLWAMGRWGIAWLVTHFTTRDAAQAASANHYLTFAVGPAVALMLAGGFGFAAAVNLGRQLR